MLQIKQKVGEIARTFHKNHKNIYISILSARKLLQNNFNSNDWEFDDRTPVARLSCEVVRETLPFCYLYYWVWQQMHCTV